MIPNSSAHCDDRGLNRNNNDNTSVAKTIANKRSKLFRPYTSGHASRRSNARAVHFTFYIFCTFEVLLLIKDIFVPNVLFSQAGPIIL